MGGSYLDTQFFSQFLTKFVFQGTSNETRIAVANQRAHDLLK